MHAIDRRAQLPALVIVAGGEVRHQLLELVATLLRGDEVDIETDLAADANEGCPAADEDRRLEVVTQPVNESMDDPLRVGVEVRHWFAALSRHRRTVSP